MAKLDPIKVEYIIRQKELGRSTKEIAAEMKVSGRWVQKLYTGYRKTGEIPTLKKPGRPKTVITDHMRDIVSMYFVKYRIVAAGIEKTLDRYGTHIPHNTIHGIMRESELATSQPKKSRKRKWTRYERTYPNSMWHTDYKLLDDGMWFIAYQDDASRFLVGYGVFAKGHRKARNRRTI